MRRAHTLSALSWLVLVVSTITFGQTVRLVNGTSVQGVVVDVTEEGLQVKTPAGTRAFTWDTLAPSTRYRYQLLFRANYDAVLRGIPRPRWSNPPDPVLESELRRMIQEGEVPQQTPAASPIRSPEATSLLIYDSMTYESVVPLEAKAFPNATFRAFEYASFIGFQYGTAATNVLYMAFDTAGPKDVSDVLYVYSPGAADFADTVRIKGFKKGSGSEQRATYRKLRVRTLFGETEAEFEFEPETAGLTTNELVLTIHVSLVRDKTKSRFMLFRRFTDLQHGDGRIPVRGICDMPNLWVGCRVEGDKAQAQLVLSMGNMLLVPRDGMDTRAAVSVVDENGNVIYRDTVKMDGFPPSPDGVAVELRRIAQAKTYSVEASMDLGPFLGTVESRDTLTLPAK